MTTGRNKIVAYAGGILLGLFGMVVVARTWLQTLFEGLGPARSADVALIVAGTACIASTCVLGAFLASSAVLIRFQRDRQASVYAPVVEAIPTPARQVVTRLPAGNWAGDANIAQLRQPRDVIELAFAGRPAVAVPRSAFYDALRMPVLRRTGWRHDTNAYQSIRQYLRERGAVDEKGRWDDKRREAIRRMAE